MATAFTVMTRDRNLKFARPLWLGFAIAPPATAFAYLAINYLIGILGIIEYSGPPDERYTSTDPVVNAISFVILSIVLYVTTLLCGPLLIFVLKRIYRISRSSLILGAMILGAIILPAEVMAAVTLFDGTITNWTTVLVWTLAIGAAASGFTALVFCGVVGLKEQSNRHDRAPIA